MLQSGCGFIYGKLIYPIKEKHSPAFERAVRWQLGDRESKAPLATEDYSRVEQLILSDPYRTDIEAIRLLPNLKELYLLDCDKVTDLSPLSGLGALELLDLADCESVFDLSSISVLKSLRRLNLKYCSKVEDITPLSSLVNLENLSISRTSVENIEPVGNLKKLKELSLDNCARLTSIEGIQGATNLETIYLTYCVGVHDATPAESLPKLKSFYVMGSGVRTLPPSLIAKQRAGELRTGRKLVE